MLRRLCGFAASLFLALCATSAFAEVTVEFVGEKFAMGLIASSDGKQETLMRPGEISLAGAEVKLESRPFFTNGYHVLCRFQVNKGAKSAISTSTTVPLEDGDKVTVYQIGIVPPKNAVVVPFKGGAMLVSMMFPAAIENPQDFKGPEKYRSSTLFIADFGEPTLSKMIAKEALKERAKIAYGHFRGSQQFSVICWANDDGTMFKAQEEASAEEVAEAVERALVLLRLNGWAGEIEKAKEILESAKKKKEEKKD